MLQTAASFGPRTSKREQSTALRLRITASFDLSKVRLLTGSGVMFLEQMPLCRLRAREHAICLPGREVFQHKKQHEYMLTKTTITTSRHTAHCSSNTIHSFHGFAPSSSSSSRSTNTTHCSSFSPHSSRFHQWLFLSLQDVQGWLLLSLQANQKYFSGWCPTRSLENRFFHFRAADRDRDLVTWQHHGYLHRRWLWRGKGRPEKGYYYLQHRSQGERNTVCCSLGTK